MNVRKFAQRIQQDSAFRQRVCFLLLWFWMSLCAGSLYMFASWEVELMDMCHLSAEQLENVYAAGQVGVGVTLIPGILYDRFGYRVTLSFATFFIILGSVTLSNAISTCSSGFTVLGFGLVQHGSATMFQTALFTSLATASESETGISAGVVSAGYGLSAAAWSFAFGLLNRDVIAFVNVTCVIWASTAVAGLVLFRYLAAPRNPYAASCASLSPRSADSLRMPQPSIIGRKKSHASDSDGGFDALNPGIAVYTSIRSIVGSRQFWGTLVQFVCLQTVGSGMFIANLSLLSGSWGFRNEQRRELVAVVSCFNAVGRIVGGLLGDKVAARNLPFSTLFLGTGVLMAMSVLICLSSLPAVIKVLATLFVGMSYGANWVILPSDLRHRFGAAHLGVTFNICTTFMAAGVYFMSHLAGEVYDAWKPQEEKDMYGQQLFCEGFNCFGIAFMAALALTCMALVLGTCSAISSRQTIQIAE